MELPQPNRRGDEGHASPLDTRPVRPEPRAGDAELLPRRSDPAPTSLSVSRERASFERLTQCLAIFFSRRGLGRLGVGLLVASGVVADAEAKKKHKHKKKPKRPAPVPPASPVPPPPGPPSDPTCNPCNTACCDAADSCIRGACCPATQVCSGNCCTSGQHCANIVPGGIKGCCDNPLSIRGETCCPTGRLETVLNCGSYQCKASLSGTGPGGCDLWCKIGYEGRRCDRDIEGFPNPNDPDVHCCCTDLIAEPGICIYP
jgi:hypothetical protein